MTAHLFLQKSVSLFLLTRLLLHVFFYIPGVSLDSFLKVFKHVDDDGVNCWETAAGTIVNHHLAKIIQFTIVSA